MKNYKKSDEHLIQLVKEGNTMGFDDLYHKYSARIYSAIFRITRDEHEAEDLLQDTFVKVYKGLKKFKFKSSFYTWLYRIAINTTLTHMKKSNKKKESTLDENLVGIDGTSHSELSNSFIKKRIKESLESLPEKQRMVFSLRFYENLRFHEVADVLKITNNNAKVLFHHAINKMKNLLGDVL